MSLKNLWIKSAPIIYLGFLKAKKKNISLQPPKTVLHKKKKQNRQTPMKLDKTFLVNSGRVE